MAIPFRHSARALSLFSMGVGLTALACVAASRVTPSPQQIARTEQMSGTTALLIAVSPVDERVVWVSGSMGTWLRTTDGGATWRAGRVQGAESLQFRDVHAVDASTAYLLSIGNGPQSRVYKTTDAGEHWTLQYTNPDSAGFFDCMSFWDAKRGIIIGDAIGTEVVILTTEDGGTEWRRIPPANLPPAQRGDGSFAASGTCLVTRPGGRAWIVASNPSRARVLRTADYGRTWTTDSLPITTHSASGPQSIAFRDDQNGSALGGGNSAQAGDVLAVSTTDGGRNWIVRTRPPMRTGVWGGVYVPSARPPAIVAVGPGGAVYSRNDGATWTVIDSLDYWSVGFASPRAGWAVGTRGRITKLSGF